MTRKMLEILKQETYTITDVANLLNKTTKAIRKWEDRNVIPRLERKSKNGWKLYTRRDLEDLLTHLFNYNWQRITVNMPDIEFMIRYCRGFVKLQDYPYRLEDDYDDMIETVLHYEDEIEVIII
jgi:hypothetical protein